MNKKNLNDGLWICELLEKSRQLLGTRRLSNEACFLVGDQFYNQLNNQLTTQIHSQFKKDLER